MKPMNCPMHCLIFRSRQRSYRELPLRLFELGTVYRYERAGTLHGLMRIRGFTQDDSHIYCTPEQARRRDRLAARLRAVRAARVRVRRLHVQPVDEGPEQVRRRRTRTGRRRPRRCARRSTATASRTRSRRATPPSTGRRSTSTSATPSAARGSCRRSSTTSTTRSASSSSTSARTTPATGRSCCTAPCSGRSSASSACCSSTTPAPCRRGCRRCRCACCRSPRRTRSTPTRSPTACAPSAAASTSSVPATRSASASAPPSWRSCPYILVVGDDDVAAGTVGVNARGSDKPERGVDLAAVRRALRRRGRRLTTAEALQALSER